MKPGSALGVQGVSRAATGEPGSVVPTVNVAKGLRPGTNVLAQRERAMAARNCSSSAYGPVGSSK